MGQHRLRILQPEAGRQTRVHLCGAAAVIVVLNAAIAKHLRAMADIVQADDPAAAVDLRRAEVRLYEIAAQHDLSTTGQAELAAAAEAARERAEGRGFALTVAR